MKTRDILPPRLLVFMMVGFIGGCGFWESIGFPDYGTTRADRVCHPFGGCSQGRWVPIESAQADLLDPEVSYQNCAQQADRGREDGWWRRSVARGLEIGECMEDSGFRLKQ